MGRVKTPRAERRRAPPELKREVFATSRLLDFCSERELTNQTGHPVGEWPLVVVKELLDNAIDAAEETGTAPVISIVVANGRVVVTDNGPGITTEVVDNILNYNLRTSSREGYVSPTRGAQGNALKTIFAMPFALNSAEVETLIESKGLLHRIIFGIDHLRQEPKINYNQGDSDVKTGIRITTPLPFSARSNTDDAKSKFLQIVRQFGWLNPHLTLDITWDGKRTRVAATNPAWEKWLPSYPTSPHWYDPHRLARLMGAYITHDIDHERESRTVREFVSQFRGLTGSAKQKQVLEEIGASRLSLPAFFGNGEDQTNISNLLAVMKKHTHLVAPKALGVIGQEHLRRRFIEAGADEETIRYKRAFVIESGLPHVIELAFSYCPNRTEREIVAGVNWSPAIHNPFRKIGPHGESLDICLAEQHVGSWNEPITLVVHLACPRVNYTDRGKTAVVMDSEQEGHDHAARSAIISGLLAVTKDWAKQRKSEERDATRAANRHYALLKRRKYSTKDAAYEVMEQSYLKVSANGTLPATARQIMYAARIFIQQKTGKPLDDQYFTQTLLPDYMNEYEVEWDVVFDDRGHFKEPHTGSSFGLGTLSVREYVQRMRDEPIFAEGCFVPGSVATYGPACRFGGVLFIEKEGFFPLLERALIAERYDIAIMSTKGLSNTASRKLVDEMCGIYDVPLLVLHDFDKSGFSIVGTLQRSNRRYEFGHDPKVIDIGLRLEDIDGLESEAAFNPGGTSAVEANLRANGAKDEEVEFLLKRRVELNAFSSDQLIAFIERKLSENRIKKIVPGTRLLASAYRMFTRSGRVERIVRDQLRKTSAEHVSVPKDLGQRSRNSSEKPGNHVGRGRKERGGLSVKPKPQAGFQGRNRDDRRGGCQAEIYRVADCNSRRATIWLKAVVCPYLHRLSC